METKFSLYFSLVKNAFVGSIFLMSQGDVSAQQPVVVSSNTVAVVPANTSTSTSAIASSAKTVDAKVSIATSSVAASESVKKVEDKSVVSEVVVVPIATNTAAVISPAKKVEDHAIVTTSTNAVVEPAKKVVVQTTQAVTDVKKDVPVSGSSEALKAELLAELTKVVQKQVKEEVNARMANLNATTSERENISLNAKPSVVSDKDEKSTTVQKPAGVSANVKVQKTPCNMLTAATCGENPACVLHNKFCRTNCAIISDEGTCIAASDCEWYGAFKRSCEFKK